MPLTQSIGQVQTLKVRHVRGIILDRVGLMGLFSVVFRATPFPICLISWPYAMVVYGDFLAECTDLPAVRLLHLSKYDTSFLFRCLRPRYHKVRRLLALRGIAE